MTAENHALDTTSRCSSVPRPDLDQYHHVLVMFSGGKDSVACVLHLLEIGVDPGRIELWHHDVDGRGHGIQGAEGEHGSQDGRHGLMDWPVTPSYCRRFAEAFGLKIYFSWKEGGFEREMLRDNTPTAPTWFEGHDGDGRTRLYRTGGNSSRTGTRLRFPQVSPDLRVRWCSAYLKIDIAAAAIAGQSRFHGKRVLVVQGERAEESAGRARYATFEPHRTDRRDGRTRRHVDVWRPVHGWSEREVWDIFRRFGVVPHPCYSAGWSRASCRFCIFGSPDQWASAAAIDPAGFQRLVDYEDRFGTTVRRDGPLNAAAAKGEIYAWADEHASQAMSHEFEGPIFVDPASWVAPLGAFGSACGPV